MNADRIVVVEDGKIIEQGNHNELIVSGGRYADLWSKQVFIRVEEDKKSPSAGEAGFVNDLSSEQTRTELSKVKPTTGGDDVDSTDPEAVDSSGANKTGTASPKHKQEVDSAEAQ